MYNVDSGARYAKLTITTSEVVKFPVKYNVFGVKGENITVKLNPTDSGDGVYSTADSDGNVVVAHYANLDTVYLYGTGEVIVWAANSPIDIPFADGGGSGGGSEPDTYLKTAAIGNDGSLTLTKQDNTTVSLTLDATPTENSTHAVTSGGVYTALQGVSPVDYSTTEQNTGRKWIDGKPIYQKTFIPTAPATYWTGRTTSSGDMIDISALNVDTFIKVEGLGSDRTDCTTNIWNIEAMSMAGVRTFYYPDKDTLGIYMQTGYIFWVTLYYTKTTDTVE